MSYACCKDCGDLGQVNENGFCPACQDYDDQLEILPDDAEEWR